MKWRRAFAVDAGNRDVGAQAVDDQQADGEEDALAQVGRLAEHAPAEVCRHLLCSRCHVRSLSSQAPPDRSPVGGAGKLLLM
jgi:ferredoxin